MPQSTNQPAGNARAHQIPVHLTEIALRSLGQVYDINLSAARVMLQTQARAASAIGLPDWSGLFNTVDERARNVFSSGAEQLVNTARRANDAAAELQREIGRVVETQAATVAETLQQGLQELGAQTSEGLNQLVETTRQQADEAERVASSVSEEIRSATQQAGETLRQAQPNGGAQPGGPEGGRTLEGGVPAGDERAKGKNRPAA